MLEGGGGESRITIFEETAISKELQLHFFPWHPSIVLNLQTQIVPQN